MTAHTELDAREALAQRLVDDVTRALETLSVYLGLELGLYQALADLGTAAQAELAATAGIAPRYAHEWLEQQAAAGYLACDDPRRPAEQRRYRLPAGHAEVLLDADSPYHAAPVAAMLAGVARVLPQLLEAYRTGDGVPYAAYGPQMRRGIAAANRPMFLHQLASTWLPAVRDIDRRLRAAPPARVLDLGCGLGASAVALARAYPRAQVLGVDLDQASLTQARAQAAEAGVADRVTFAVGDACTGRRRGPVRPGHRVRGAPRHRRPRRGAADGPRAAGRRRQRPGRRRTRGRHLHHTRGQPARDAVAAGRVRLLLASSIATLLAVAALAVALTEVC